MSRWRDVPAATAGKVYENCIMQHLHHEWNPPGSVLKHCHCFEICQSPLIKLQPSFSSRLYLMVCQFDILASVILWQRQKEERIGKRKKERFLIFLSALPWGRSATQRPDLPELITSKGWIVQPVAGVLPTPGSEWLRTPKKCVYILPEHVKLVLLW